MNRLRLVRHICVRYFLLIGILLFCFGIQAVNAKNDTLLSGGVNNVQTTAITDNQSIYKDYPENLPAKIKISIHPWDGFCPKNQLSGSVLPCEKYHLQLGAAYAGIEAANDKWMNIANQEALDFAQSTEGAYGAVIVQIDDETGKVIRYWVAHSRVAESKDPTAHADLTIIRQAAKELGVTDLGHIKQATTKLSQPGKWSHCVIYSSAEPCPMCLTAIYWAGIKTLAFAANHTKTATQVVNFGNKMVYERLT